MERIGLRYSTPDTLVEMAHYDDDIPHYLYWRDFKSAYYSPLHYADSYEVMLLRGLRGEVTIAGNSFQFAGNRLFAIPPNIVHDLRVERGDGFMYVFHANFQFLKQYVNIEKIFSYRGMDINDICYDIPEVEEGWRIFRDIIRHDGWSCFLCSADICTTTTYQNVSILIPTITPCKGWWTGPTPTSLKKLTLTRPPK